ncbi:hypothetical protein D3C72_1260540 [compost metagenome]
MRIGVSSLQLGGTRACLGAGELDLHNRDSRLAAITHSVGIGILVHHACDADFCSPRYKTNGVLTRSIGIKDVEKVAPAEVFVAFFGQPDVLCRHDIAIRARHLHRHLRSLAGIRNTCISKALRDGCELEDGIVALYGHLRRSCLVLHLRIHTIRLVDAENITILGEEVTHLVTPWKIDTYVLDQGVGTDFFDQRGNSPAQRISMCKARSKVDKLACQTGHHGPAPHFGDPGFNISKVQQQAFACWLVSNEST